MIYGMDCSIRNVAIVSANRDVIWSSCTGLSLQDSTDNIISMGRGVGRSLHLTYTDKLYVDATHQVWQGRYKQFSYNQILIASICASTDAKIEFVSPRQLRSLVGIQGKAKKEAVWTAYEDKYTVGGDVLSLRTEHERDAYCLALWGYDTTYFKLKQITS